MSRSFTHTLSRQDMPYPPPLLLERFSELTIYQGENKGITDFFSFYSLESSVINHPQYSVVRAAYLFYYASEVAFAEPFDKSAYKKRLNELIHNALILARDLKFDVFNALSLMDNALFLEEQKFGAGDGQLHHYLFNYLANPIAGGVNRKNELDEGTCSGIGFVQL
jgi:glycylpeptide N-tetradecanoyltransferase